LLLILRSRLILLLIMDSATAKALGVRTTLWSIGLALWLGLSVGLSIRIAGMLYTFGFLVLPALAAKNVCREVRSMFFVAPVLALATGITGFILSNYWDFPPGQMSVALLAGLLPMAWLTGALFRRH
jgi:ABC-type Mn2+/Zn2+ transport system permease subunit